jgi:hypothetical protein
MKSHSFRPLHVLLAGTLTCFFVLLVQAEDKPKETSRPAVQKSSDQPAPAALRKLQPEDYGQWESFGGRTQLTNDGRWLAYSIRRVNGKNEVRLRMLATDAKEIFEDASNPTFSAPAAWFTRLKMVMPFLFNTSSRLSMVTETE